MKAETTWPTIVFRSLIESIYDVSIRCNGKIEIPSSEDNLYIAGPKLLGQ